jgi:tellurite resistance protein TerC
MNEYLPWVLFNLFVLAMLALDLGILNRRAHTISFREAAAWSAMWILLALVFNGLLYFWRGPQSAIEFLTGYVLEKSLSMDNIFVFAVIFSSAAVGSQYQHRVLFWGVLGALVTRAAFIFAGVGLVLRFHWILYAFGIFLVLTGLNLFWKKQRGFDPARNRVMRWARKVFAITEDYEGGALFVRRGGRRYATPLFLVLVMIEITDVIFATDSIPAIFSVTQDPFIIFTSNVFAILGLRSLYFVLSGAIRRFRYLHIGLSIVLVFVGTKMLLADAIKLPTGLALLVILLILMLTILASHCAERAAQAKSAPSSSVMKP